jgi:hypothetical protein
MQMATGGGLIKGAMPLFFGKDSVVLRPLILMVRLVSESKIPWQ